jgi:hypothetical protein
MDESDALYRVQMDDISVRFEAIRRILGSRKPGNVRTELDNEFLWLQLRMIVELVAFGGITADQDRYAALRADVLKNPDYTRDGKVNKILPELAKISPHFLPIALNDRGSRDTKGVMHLEGGSAVPELTRLVEIHERAGMYMHIDNPFSPTKRSETVERLKNSRETFLADYEYLWGILRSHAKVCLEFNRAVDTPTELANAKRAWIVQFDRPKRGQVSILIGEASISDPENARRAD